MIWVNTLSRLWYLLERADITALIHWKDFKMKGKGKGKRKSQRWDLTWKLRWWWREMWRHREGRTCCWQVWEKAGELYNLEVKLELKKLYLEGHLGLRRKWRCLLHPLQGFLCLLIVSCIQREMVVGEKLICPLPYFLQRPSLFYKSPQTRTAGLVHKGSFCI